MTVLIYSKPDCVFCAKSKVYMAKHKIEYTEFLMGRDITRDEVIEQFPLMRTMPIILIDGKIIGGYTQLTEYFGGEHKRVNV